MASPVETVQTIYRAFAQGDIPAVLAAFDPEIEWVTPETLPWSRGNYRGPEGVREYFASFASQLDLPRVVPEELLAAGNRVVATGYEVATARATGQAFTMRFAHVWTVREDKVVRMEGIAETGVALAAFG